MKPIHLTLALALAAALSLMLVACSGKSDTTGNTAGNSTMSNAHHEHGEHMPADLAGADNAEYANPHPGYCPVTGDPFEDPPIIVEHDGKKYRLCCDDCIADFKADPEKYIKAPATPHPEGEGDDDHHDHHSH
ncbi:MAG: TRASH domain-containing protein [Planctomycetota bacterium]